MTEELLIDNQAVELNTGVAVTLNYKSNLLGDIDAIECNYTQTISLPKTAHNRAILDNPTAPSYDSAFRRAKHSAAYRRNGVQIIRDGYAVLLDSKDTYEIGIYWGIRSVLDDWLDNGPNLQDLGWEPASAEKWNRDKETDALTKYKTAFVWAKYDCGLSDYWLERVDRARYPFVSAAALFELICDNLGIAWNAGDDVKTAMIGTGVFLPTRNTQTKDADESTSLSLAAHGLSMSFAASTWYTLDRANKSNDWYDYKITYNTFTVNYDGTAKFEINLNLKSSGSSWYMVHLIVYHNGSQVASSLASLGINGNTATLTRTVSIACESNDEIAVVCGAATRSENNKISLVSGSYVKFTPPGVDEPINTGDTFPASLNMPDISQLDFFKAICAMFGLYVMPDGQDGLQVVTFESLTDNRANAVDWSDKLLYSGTPCEPAEIAFSFGNWAQKNYFKYKADDDVDTDADKELRIADAGLDDENTVVELPFAASDNVATGDDDLPEMALLPHYGWPDDAPTEDTEDDDLPDVDETELSPRIISFTQKTANKTPLYAVFDKTFNALLRQWYQTLISMLNDMIVITESFRLTEFDLLDLDFLKPVYLRQYGRFYGIVSIQTKDDGTCDVELAQLPVSTD